MISTDDLFDLAKDCEVSLTIQMYEDGAGGDWGAEIFSLDKEVCYAWKAKHGKDYLVNCVYEHLMAYKEKVDKAIREKRRAYLEANYRDLSRDEIIKDGLKRPYLKDGIICPPEAYNRQDIVHYIIEKDGEKLMFLVKMFMYKGNCWVATERCDDALQEDKDSPVFAEIYKTIDRAVQQRIDYEDGKRGEEP